MTLHFFATLKENKSLNKSLLLFCNNKNQDKLCIISLPNIIIPRVDLYSFCIFYIIVSWFTLISIVQKKPILFGGSVAFIATLEMCSILFKNIFVYVIVYVIVYVNFQNFT